MVHGRGFSRFLLVLIALVAVLGMLSLWAARQLLDQDSWDKTNTALIEDSTIRDAVSVYLVDQVYDNVDVAATLSEQLPPRLKPLAGPAAGALRSVAERVTKRALATPFFQKLWAVAVSGTHKQLINLIEDRGKVIKLPGGGAVVLDLKALVAQVAARLGLPKSVTDQLPPNVGAIKIASSEQVATSQKAVKWLKRLTVLFVILLPILIVLAVYLADGRRREMVLSAALTVAGAALLVLAVRRAAGNHVVDALASTASVRPPAEHAYAIATGLLKTLARVVLVLSLLLALSAWLAGPATWATKARTWMRPALVQSPELIYGVVVGGLVILLAAGLVPGIEKPLGIVFLLITAVAAVELVRRQAIAEAPPGT